MSTFVYTFIGTACYKIRLTICLFLLLSSMFLYVVMGSSAAGCRYRLLIQEGKSQGVNIWNVLGDKLSTDFETVMKNDFI